MAVATQQKEQQVNRGVQSSSVKPSTQQLMSLCENTAKTLGIRPNMIKVVVKGRQNPIRSLEVTKEMIGELNLAISEIAKIHGTTREIDKSILKACSKLVLNHFKSLSIPELSHAYELANAGKIEVETKVYGSFSIASFGEVLRAYKKYRNKIIATYEKEDEQRKRTERKAREKRKEEQVLISNIPELIKEYRRRYRDEGWEEVVLLGFPFKVVEEKGYLTLSEEEKKEIFERAKVEAANQLRLKIKFHGPLELKKTAKASLEQLEEKGTCNLAVQIARKIAVYEHLIMPETLPFLNEKDEDEQ